MYESDAERTATYCVLLDHTGEFHMGIGDMDITGAISVEWVRSRQTTATATITVCQESVKCTTCTGRIGNTMASIVSTACPFKTVNKFPSVRKKCACHMTEPMKEGYPLVSCLQQSC